MYKTLNRLNVYLHGDENPYTFSDASALSSGTTALSQVKNCRDIDTILNEGGIPTIIPYHAIDNIEVLSVRIEEEDPVDDNCNTGGDVEPGTLKIVNASGDTLLDVLVAIDAEIEGTYGDLTFTIDAESTSEHPLSTATIATLADGGTVTATGLPDGVTLAVDSGVGIYQGTVSCTITLTGEQPGPGPSPT